MILQCGATLLAVWQWLAVAWVGRSPRATADSALLHPPTACSAEPCPASLTSLRLRFCIGQRPHSRRSIELYYYAETLCHVPATMALVGSVLVLFPPCLRLPW